MDDAISVKPLKKMNQFKIGLHIIDVDQWISNSSALQEIAQKRYTTIYIKNKNISMLPDKLSEYLSLVAKNYKYVVSLYIKVNASSGLIDFD